MRGTHPRKRVAKEAIGLGFGPVPNDHHAAGEVLPYGTNGAGIKTSRVHRRIAIPDTGNEGPIERRIPPAGDIVIVAGVKRNSNRSDRIGPIWTHNTNR